MEDDAFGTLPPPSMPQERSSLPPQPLPSDAPRAPSGVPSSADPFDVSGMLDEGNPSRARTVELSPELAQLLDAAE
ncbi:MAG: hypothetical protein ABI134_12995, partial [Byssovorax sp.]